MEIYTIAYNNDLDLLRLQLKSFSTFLFPKNKVVNVIINELKEHAKNDEEELRKLTYPFKLNFLYRDDLLPEDASEWGWISQQVCKLLVPETSNYVIFDCKDILINNIHIEEFIPELRPNKAKSPSFDLYMEFYNDVSKILDTEFNVYPHIVTPRVISINVRDKIFHLLGGPQGVSDFFKKYKMPSEFVLHDLVKIHLGEEFFGDYRPTISKHMIWNDNDLKLLDIDKVYKKSKIIKIHHRLSDSSRYNKLYRKLFKRAVKGNK